MNTYNAINLMCLFMACVSTAGQAGTWNQENWGQMYWGDNPATAPVAAPTYTVKVDGDRFLVEFTNYAEGSGEDGW